MTGIGIGVPGRVDARARAVLSGGFLDLPSAELADALERALARPVSVDNDCNMALVAEMASGAAQGCGQRRDVHDRHRHRRRGRRSTAGSPAGVPQPGSSAI